MKNKILLMLLAFNISAMQVERGDGILHKVKDGLNRNSVRIAVALLCISLVSDVLYYNAGYAPHSNKLFKCGLDCIPDGQGCCAGACDKIPGMILNCEGFNL